jgi:hypothetical protein
MKEAVNRTNNLIGVTVVALAGLAFLPEAFVEDEMMHKVDDILLFWLGIGAIVWYKMGKNRFSKSIAPILFTGAALVIKIFGMIIERADKEDLGDEFGGVILFILATVFVIYLYKKSEKMLESAS